MRALRTPLALLLLGPLAACGDGSGSPDAGVVDAVEPDAGEPLDCSGRAELPVNFQVLPGFTSSEDFAFDTLGRYVAFGEEGDLIAIEYDGTRHLLVPDVAGGGAGTHFVPGGALIVASGDQLIKVTPEGAVTTLASGLLYPNGMDVARDGTIYVAEQNGSRLRAVNPETGDFQIVGIGMVAPNGVAIADDEMGVYVGSFGGGVVYYVDLTNPEPESRTRIFGRTPGGQNTPEPTTACAGLDEGDDCDIPFGNGRCQLFGGALDCQLVPPCDGLEAGDVCTTPFGGPGVCEEQGGQLVCTPPPPCANEGDACTASTGTAGVCSADLVCDEVACAELVEGDPCTMTNGAEGVCTDWDFGGMVCQPPPQCPAAGADCTTFDDADGICTETSFGIICLELACIDLEVGDPCIDAMGREGVCSGDAEFRYCFYSPPCFTAQPGELCETTHGVAGTCDSSALGTLCQPLPGCGGASVGDPCVTTDRALDGHCDGGLTCVADDPCNGLVAGDECHIDYDVAGTCVDDDGALDCIPNNACADLAPGELCFGPLNTFGTCVSNGGGDPACLLEAEPFFAGCDDELAGMACEVERFGHTFDGTCIDTPGDLYCDVPEDNVTPCIGLEVGDSCEVRSPTQGLYTGECFNGGDALFCGGGGGGSGGLDGLNIDACGYAYVTEFGPGVVWRISPDGLAEKAATLPSGWIPNMHWGPGIGGFEKNILYVADRTGGSLFGLELGVPGGYE
jgi:hypothetical protein